MKNIFKGLGFGLLAFVLVAGMASSASAALTLSALTIDSSGALNLGTVSATGLSIGKTGITTVNNGALTVTQALGNTALTASRMVFTDGSKVLSSTGASAAISGAVSDETGTGVLVFATSPTLVTPDLGVPSAAVLTNATGTASGLTAGAVTDFTPAGGSLILAGADALTFTTSGTTGVTLPTTGTLATLAGAESLSNKIFLGVASCNAAAPCFAITGTTDMGMYNTDAVTLAFATQGTMRARVGATNGLEVVNGINNTAIGNVGAAAGSFTTLAASSATNKGTCAIGSTCASITVATGSQCTASDATGPNAVQVVVSGTTLTITGTGTDTVSYICL